MRVVKIKNVQDVADAYCAQEILAGEYYTLSSQEEINRFATDTKVREHLWAVPAKILINDGTVDITDKAKADLWLQGSDPVDAERRPYFRNVITKPDWYYSPHSLDFYTSKHNSLYNRSHDGAGIDDGTDAGDAELAFYDVSGNIMYQQEGESDVDYQARLTSGCIKTIMFWEKRESFDVVGAYLNIEENPTERAYLWVIAAPDIPYAWGGSKPFMGRGMNLKMMKAKDNHYFDAKTTSSINYDPENHTGKIAVVVKHAAGAQIGIQIVFVVYEE